MVDKNRIAVLARHAIEVNNLGRRTNSVDPHQERAMSGSGSGCVPCDECLPRLCATKDGSGRVTALSFWRTAEELVEVPQCGSGMGSGSGDIIPDGSGTGSGSGDIIPIEDCCDFPIGWPS